MVQLQARHSWSQCNVDDEESCWFRVIGMYEGFHAVHLMSARGQTENTSPRPR